jgi:hypothetical protein
VCGSGIAEPQGVEGPALRSPAGVTTAWFGMSTEQLEHAVLSHTAVCARCHETGQRAERYDQLSIGALSVEPRHSARILFLRRATTRISGGTPVQPAI